MRCSLCSALAAGLVCALAGAAAGQAKEFAPLGDPDAGVKVDAVVANGYRRTFQVQRQPLAPGQMEQILAAGKQAEIDPESGQLVLRTFEDHLPADWQHVVRPDGVPADSYGNPIVNDLPGLPAWSQRDVDALRGEISQWAATLPAQSGAVVAETEYILGSHIGHALARSIKIGDLVDLSRLSDATARAAIEQMRFIESTRFSRQDIWGYTYAPTAYGPEALKFLASRGVRVGDVQRFDAAPQPAAVPSGCYVRTAPAIGITFISGFTTIWQQTGDDDISSDVPIGFPFVFYGCDNLTASRNVRVSSNGYATFYERGGGAVFGTVFSNAAITSTTDPDGFVAPFWDDFWLAPAQGNTDRVAYLTEGSSPNRIFTVEWFSISHLGGTTTDFHFFQVKLFEGVNAVEFHYGSGGNWSPDTNTSGTMGMEDYTGDDGDCGPNCLATNITPTENYRFVPPAPANNNCAAAAFLSVGTNFGNIGNATNDGTSTCGVSGTNRDVWWRYTATCAGTLVVTTCGTHDAPGTDLGMDTTLTVFGTCGGAQVTCNDDAGAGVCPGAAGNQYDSRVIVAMAAGQTVLIRVSHFNVSLADGNYRLHAWWQPYALVDTENEPCGADTNGGCNMAVPTMEAILLNRPLYGFGWINAGGTRDTDWFRLRLEGGQRVYFTGYAEFPYHMIILNDVCPASIITSVPNLTACTETTLSFTAPATNSYLFFMAENFGSPLNNCNPGNQRNTYWIRVGCAPCPADFNNSGGTPDDADIAAFFAAWNNGDPCADVNNSGATPDDADVAAFFILWNAGGCA